MTGTHEHAPHRGTTVTAAVVDRDRYPNLAAWLDWDREQHIQQAMQAGMTRAEAEWHDADERHER